MAETQEDILSKPIQFKTTIPPLPFQPQLETGAGNTASSLEASKAAFENAADKFKKTPMGDVYDLNSMNWRARRALRTQGGYVRDALGGVQYIEPGTSWSDLNNIRRTFRDRANLAQYRYNPYGTPYGGQQVGYPYGGGYYGYGMPGIPGTAPQTQSKHYRYSFDSDVDGDFNWSNKISASLLKAMYDNKRYDVLDQLVTDGSIGNSGLNTLYKNLLGQTGDKVRFDRDALQKALDNKYITQEQFNNLTSLIPTNPDGTTAVAPAASQETVATPKPATAPTATVQKPATTTASNANQGGMDIYTSYLNANKIPYKRSPLGGLHVGNYIYYDNGRVFNTKTKQKGNYKPDVSIQGLALNPNTITWDAQKTTTKKHGGKLMRYFQQGGQVQQDPRQVLASIFMTAAQGDMETLEHILPKVGLDMNGLVKLCESWAKKKDAEPELAELAAKALHGLQQAAQVARHGAALQYIKRLNNECPKGYELTMYKVGGRICKKCQKVEEACKGKKLEEGGESPLVTKFKNGRKCKK